MTDHPDQFVFPQSRLVCKRNEQLHRNALAVPGCPACLFFLFYVIFPIIQSL